MASNFNKRFGARIKELRKIAGVSQEKLSEIAGVSPKTVSYWENGHNPVTFSKIPIIAKALNVPIYRLFVFPDFKADKDYLAILENLSAEKLNALLDILKMVENLK